LIIVFAVIDPPSIEHLPGPSLPEGKYLLIESSQLEAGIPTLLCIEGSYGDLAIRREYAPRPPLPSACRGAQMAKIIAGLPGDTIRVIQDSVRVNQRAWLHAPMYQRDSKERRMPVKRGTFILSDSECYALSLWYAKSYDSRYFGPIPCPTPPVIQFVPVSPTHLSIIDSLRTVTLGL